MPKDFKTFIMRGSVVDMAVGIVIGAALTIAALLGSGMRNVIIALSVALIPSYARLMCGQVLSVKQNEYIEACRAIGATNWRIMFRHVPGLQESAAKRFDDAVQIKHNNNIHDGKV